MTSSRWGGPPGAGEKGSGPRAGHHPLHIIAAAAIVLMVAACGTTHHNTIPAPPQGGAGFLTQVHNTGWPTQPDNVLIETVQILCGRLDATHNVVAALQQTGRIMPARESLLTREQKAQILVWGVWNICPQNSALMSDVFPGVRKR